MEMKKTFPPLAILASFFLASTSFAGEIMGYPVTPTQARFYLLILGLLAVSAGMVSVAYLAFWVLDLKKKRREGKKIAVLEEQGFAGELAVAAQSAK